MPIHLMEGDTFKFSCYKGIKCFTACCSDTNIILGPFDILRLKQRLGLSSTEFLAKYTTPDFIKDTDLPVARLKMQDDGSQRCVFVTGEGCTIYGDRPSACRYYAIGKGTMHKTGLEGNPDESFYFVVKEPHCFGHEEDKTWTVAEWRKDQGVELYDEMNRGWEELILKKKSLGFQVSMSEETQQIFFMITSDVDRFRIFVLESSFLHRYDVDPETVEKIKTDDIELYRLGFKWLRTILYNEKLIPLKPGVIESYAKRMAAKPPPSDEWEGS